MSYHHPCQSVHQLRYSVSPCQTLTSEIKNTIKPYQSGLHAFHFTLFRVINPHRSLLSLRLLLFLQQPAVWHQMARLFLAIITHWPFSELRKPLLRFTIVMLITGHLLRWLLIIMTAFSLGFCTIMTWPMTFHMITLSSIYLSNCPCFSVSLSCISDYF